MTRIMTSASDLNTVCDQMLQAMYNETREWNAELSAGIHQVEKVTELINALEGRVSQETAATNE
jgi:hypothetical protein